MILMKRSAAFFRLAVVALALSWTMPAFPRQETAGASQKLAPQVDSLRAQLESIRKRTEAIEAHNSLLMKALESQLNEAERKSRFLEIVLAVLGGLFGTIVAVITFANIWQNKWERNFQDTRERREGKVVKALRENVETVTNLMQIISEGQRVATFVREAVERQNLQFKSFKDDILAINQRAEKLLKDGKLKRRVVRQREVQGEIELLGDIIEKKLLLFPLIPFDKGDEKLSAIALYVRALQLFLDSNYADAGRLFKEAHLIQSGDLLWQIPFYEGLIAKNEGSYPAALSSFDEAITAREKTEDPELGSHTEIAETLLFKSAQYKNQIERQEGLLDVRNRCLKIIQKAEGSEQRADFSLKEIQIGTNPNMTDEFRRLQSRCFLIAGNTFWFEQDYEAALAMYKKSSQLKLASEYVYSSIGQALDKLREQGGASDDPLPYYEKAFSALRSLLGRHDERQNRILRASVFALCVKRLKAANKIEGTWEPIQYRIEAERIVEDELKFKNPNIKLFSPFSKIQMTQEELVEELRREIG
jgi:TolA-binding protein